MLIVCVLVSIGGLWLMAASFRLLVRPAEFERNERQNSLQARAVGVGSRRRAGQGR